jgi:hypothetical protein
LSLQDAAVASATSSVASGSRRITFGLFPRCGDDSFENCIPFCFDCHAEVEHYNDQHPRGRKFSESELRKHRDTWFSKVKEMNTLAPLPSDSPQVIQAVSGNGNMVGQLM